MRKALLAAGLLLVFAMVPVASAENRTPTGPGNVIRTVHTNVNVIEGTIKKEKTLDVGVEVYPGPPNGTHEVDYEIVGVTATRGEDFDALLGRGTLTLAGAKGTIPIKIKGDIIDEVNETIRIDLYYPRCTSGGPCDLDAEPNPRSGYVTIADDDGGETPGPDIRGLNNTVDARKQSACEIEVALDYGWDKNVTVDFETENLEATQGDDYKHTEGTMVFSPGQIRKSLFIEIDPDRKANTRHDRFLVEFSNAKGGHLSEESAQCTFLDQGPPRR